MPYVRRAQQPFSPATAGAGTLIGWYDNSNTIYGSPQTLSNNTLIDKGNLHNNLTASGITTVAYSKFTLSNGTAYTNKSQIEVRNRTILLIFRY